MLLLQAFQPTQGCDGGFFTILYRTSLYFKSFSEGRPVEICGKRGKNVLNDFQTPLLTVCGCVSITRQPIVIKTNLREGKLETITGRANFQVSISK